MSLYTMFKVTIVAAFDLNMPCYILWWQELWYSQKMSHA